MPQQVWTHFRCSYGQAARLAKLFTARGGRSAVPLLQRHKVQVQAPQKSVHPSRTNA